VQRKIIGFHQDAAQDWVADMLLVATSSMSATRRPG
jgi:hypothetical protein